MNHFHSCSYSIVGSLYGHTLTLDSYFSNAHDLSCGDQTHAHFPSGIFRSPAQAAVFEWKFLAIWTALGFVGVILSERTGFPDPLGPQSRFALPAILGIAFGILAIVTDHLTHWTQLVASQMHLSSIHIEFPESLLIYPGGAVIVEVIYRLFPVPFLLWLISNVLLKGKAQTKIFWTLAALTFLIEPLCDLGLKKYTALYIL